MRSFFPPAVPPPACRATVCWLAVLVFLLTCETATQAQSGITPPLINWPQEEELEDGEWRMEDGERFSAHPPSSILHSPSFQQPGCWRHTFREDAAAFLPMLRDDARGVANWNNAAILGGALAGSIAIRHELDGDVRRNTARHPERWGEGSRTLGKLGEVQYHLPVMFLLYGASLDQGDDELRDFSTTLISAYTINGLSTLAVKGIANTDRPSKRWNGGMFGFPSFHASSTFTIASVIDEYYGYQAGLPAYALAGLISWSRIDERDHDLSDVVFGAAMGYVIGHAVAGRHLRCDSRVRLLPYFHPVDGSSGLMLDVMF